VATLTSPPQLPPPPYREGGWERGAGGEKGKNLKGPPPPIFSNKIMNHTSLGSCCNAVLLVHGASAKLEHKVHRMVVHNPESLQASHSSDSINVQVSDPGPKKNCASVDASYAFEESMANAMSRPHPSLSEAVNVNGPSGTRRSAVQYIGES